MVEHAAPAATAVAGGRVGAGHRQRLGRHDQLDALAPRQQAHDRLRIGLLQAAKAALARQRRRHPFSADSNGASTLDHLYT
ncbi:hypothetical protein [Cupriavidus necator]|uniref:hypothetical protein n=1 Tax=Cupriavidus necator TaxID=106590 RepID=UPI0005B4DDC9|nr:hypothetical protein [Cupriavidus necator]